MLISGCFGLTPCLRFLEAAFLLFEGGSPDSSRNCATGSADPEGVAAACSSILSASFPTVAVEVADSSMSDRVSTFDFATLIAGAASCCIFGAKRIMNAHLPIRSFFVLIEQRACQPGSHPKSKKSPLAKLAIKRSTSLRSTRLASCNSSGWRSEALSDSIAYQKARHSRATAPLRAKNLQDAAPHSSRLGRQFVGTRRRSVGNVEDVRFRIGRRRRETPPVVRIERAAL